MQCPKCEGKKFSFTETTTTVSCFLVDLEGDSLPQIKKSHCSKTYSFTCIRCGEVIYYGENFPVEHVSPFREEGIIYDIDELLDRIQELKN